MSKLPYNFREDFFFNSTVTITYLIIMTFTILKDRVHNRNDGIQQN